MGHGVSTGRRAGEANVAEGLGVDPPPPPTRGGWLGGRVAASRPGDTVGDTYNIVTPTPFRGDIDRGHGEGRRREDGRCGH